VLCCSWAIHSKAYNHFLCERSKTHPCVWCERGFCSSECVGPKFEVDFDFSDLHMCISRHLKPKKWIRNGFKSISVGSGLFVNYCSLLILSLFTSNRFFAMFSKRIQPFNSVNKSSHLILKSDFSLETLYLQNLAQFETLLRSHAKF